MGAGDPAASRSVANLASEHDETTPLLAATQDDATITKSQDAENQHERENEDAFYESNEFPLPLSQIFLLCFARFVEPVVYFSIFPFVQEMVVHVGAVPEAQVGFYSGLIESLFSLTQMTLMVPWGRASDRFGRKPVLLVSMCGIMLFTTLFGFSQTLWQMIMFRCLAGLFGGSVVTLRTMTAEHSTPKTQARAFSFFQFASNLGIFVGPFIGGALADPAHQYPSVFGKVKFFNHFPYALPTLVTGAICGFALLTTIGFVKETMKEKNTGSGQSNGSSSEEVLSIPEVLRSPGVLVVIIIYGNIFLLAFGYTALYPVFAFTPVEIGGCGFSPLFISIFLGAAGLFQSVYGLLIFPPLQLRYGTKAVLKGCALFWPVLFILHPLANYLLKNDLNVIFWILIWFLELGVSALSMAFIAAQLAVNDAAPSPNSLATLNGIALAVMSGTRAFTPVLFTTIFATSVSRQILSGQLAWIILTLSALPLMVLLRKLPSRLGYRG